MTLFFNAEKRAGDFRLAARFEAKAGEITTLFGRSGAGKSTIIELIAGLQRPDEGRILMDARVLTDPSIGINLRPEARRTGCVFQEGRLFPHLSVRRNLTYGAKRAEGNGPTFDHVVDVLGIKGLLDRKPATLSGGEAQRVAIGRALLSGPEMLLMDEPLASLDAGRKGEILPMIEALRDELDIPILYVSHAYEEVVRLSDTVILLNEGQVAAQGPVEDVLSRLDLRPMTGRFEAGTVIEAAVARHDAADGLSALDFAGGQLLVPQIDVAAGDTLRAHIRARDVSIALKKPTDVSFLNVFPGTVTEIGAGADEGATVLDVRIELEGGTALWSRITRKSVTDLKLAPGASVHALVKAVALDARSLGVRRKR